MLKRFRAGDWKVAKLNTGNAGIDKFSGKKCIVTKTPFDDEEETYVCRFHDDDEDVLIPMKREELLPVKRTNFDRYYDLVRRFQEEVFRTYQDARRSHLTLQTMVDRRNDRVYSKPEYQKLPARYKDSISSFDSAMWAVMQADWLETRWMYKGKWELKPAINGDWANTEGCQSFWIGTEIAFHPEYERIVKTEITLTR